MLNSADPDEMLYELFILAVDCLDRIVSSTPEAKLSCI